MDELLPCPFCGGRAFLGDVSVQCGECLAEMVDLDLKRAVKLWNRRAASAPNIDRLVAALATMVSAIDLRRGDDQELANAFRAAQDAAYAADLEYDEVKRAGFRALVLAALQASPAELADPPCPICGRPVLAQYCPACNVGFSPSLRTGA